MKMVIFTVKSPDNPRNEFAQRTWLGAEVHIIDCERTTKTGCFYVRDVFDKALLIPGDAYVFMNSDIALVPEWLDIIAPAVEKFGVAYAHRVDVTKFSKQLTLKDLAQSKANLGMDLFAFKPEWWQKYRNEFPDGIIGREGWDFAAVFYARKTGFDRIPPIIYHEAHPSFWNRQHNLQGHPDQKEARKTLTEWAHKVGAQKYLGSNYLFKSIYNQFADVPPYAPMLTNKERKEIQSEAIRLANLKWKRRY